MSAFLFRHRSSLLLVLLWPLLVWTLGTQPGPTPLQIAGGVAALAAGGVLRLASARCLGRGARVHRADARGGLVSWGPYAWSRNPLYVAAGLIFTGVGLLAGGAEWALLLLPATFVVYTPVVRHEEQAVQAAVGEDYVDYRRRVWRWLAPPSVQGDPHEREPWGEVLRREKGLLPLLVLGGGAVLATVEGLLPLRGWIGRLTQAVGIDLPWLCAIGVVVGAVANSLKVESKRKRHEARRAAKREGADGAGEAEAPGSPHVTS